MSRYTQYFGKNNVKSELAVGISSIATSIQVKTDEGNLRGTDFPVLGTLEHFDSTGKVSKREIVKVVSRSGDTFTVIRKFAPCPPSDDATSQTQVSNSFDPDDSFSIYIPYEILNAVSEAIQDLYNNGNDRLFAKKTSGLGFEITPGNVRFETGEAYYSGGTGTVVDNAVNYVMLDSSMNIVITQEELLDVQNISIAEITAVNGEITQIVSRKIDSFAGRMGGGGDPVYGDGSDGDLIISENTILNAGQQYNFSNLTICAGATVSFSGNGGAKIHVANCFINEGIIDATDLDVDGYCYRDSTSFCMLYNCGRNGTPNAGCGGLGGIGCQVGTEGECFKGGDGGSAIETPAGCSDCVGAGGTNTAGKGGNGYCMGAGGGGGYCNAGCSGNGFDGGNGGNSKCFLYSTTRRFYGGGGGGGGFYTGNGGNGGAGAGICCSAEDVFSGSNKQRRMGGNGGNGGILGNGGNGGNGNRNDSSGSGGNGGNGGAGVCGGNGGTGGVMYHSDYYCGVGAGDGGEGGIGFYGGNGGNGGYVSRICCYVSGCQYSGNGGKGGDGIVPGKGGNGGNTNHQRCNYTYKLGNGGQGGTGCARLHSINIKAKHFCNVGCILSVGSVGGQGGNGGSTCSTCACFAYITAGNGGRGGKGGQGGVIQIITDEVLERGTISVAGGIGGTGGCKGLNCYDHTKDGINGSQGEQGDSGTLYFFILEG